MVMDFFKSLTPQYRGIIYSIAGLLILLDALNILSKSIHAFVILAALGLILYGIKLTNILDLITKKN
jgi:hypothetical protein